MEDHRTKWQRHCAKRCGFPMRGVIALLSFFVLASIFSQRLSFSFVLNIMVRPGNDTELQETHKICQDDEEKVDIPPVKDIYQNSIWSDSLESFILSCFYIGYIVTHIPGGVLSDLYGAKWVLSVSILTSSVTTMLMPIAINNGEPVKIIISRIILGAAQGSITPSISCLLSSWVPKRERATLSTMAYCGGTMGVVLTGYSSAYLLNNFAEWEITHHVFGITGLVCFLLIVLTASSHPRDQPCIKPEEVVFLNEQIKSYEISFCTIPWRAIILNKVMISVIVGQMGHDWGFFMILSCLPKYLNHVVRISLSANGFLMCLPFIAMFVWINLAGMLADWVVKTETMEVGTQRKLYTFLSAICPGTFTLFASFAECHKFLVVSFLTISVFTSGFFYSGLKLSPMDLSTSYAGTLMGITNGIGSLSALCCPIVTSFMTPHGTLDEWRNVFWLAFFIWTITSLGFVKWGSADVQPFDPSFLTHEQV